MFKNKEQRKELKKQLRYLMLFYKAELQSELLKRDKVDLDKSFEFVESDLKKNFSETLKLIELL